MLNEKQNSFPSSDRADNPHHNSPASITPNVEKNDTFDDAALTVDTNQTLVETLQIKYDNLYKSHTKLKELYDIAQQNLDALDTHCINIVSENEQLKGRQEQLDKKITGLEKSLGDLLDSNRALRLRIATTAIIPDIELPDCQSEESSSDLESESDHMESGDLDIDHAKSDQDNSHSTCSHPHLDPYVCGSIVFSQLPPRPLRLRSQTISMTADEAEQAYSSSSKGSSPI